MASKINIAKRELPERQYELEVTDEGEVRSSGRVVYTDNRSGWASRCPKIGSGFPDDGSLRLRKISMEGMAGDLVRVTLSYELPRSAEGGSSEFSGAEETEYSMDYSCSEEPLLTHPDFSDIGGDERDALLAVSNGASVKDTLGVEGKVIEDVIKSELGKKALELMQKGVVSFLSPGAVYSETSTVLTLELSGVGKKGSPGGRCPSAGGRYNWLKEGVSARATGTGRWRQTVSWRLSGPGGWEPSLY